MKFIFNSLNFNEKENNKKQESHITEKDNYFKFTYQEEKKSREKNILLKKPRSGRVVKKRKIVDRSRDKKRKNREFLSKLMKKNKKIRN